MRIWHNFLISSADKTKQTKEKQTEISSKRKQSTGEYLTWTIGLWIITDVYIPY